MIGLVFSFSYSNTLFENDVGDQDKIEYTINQDVSDADVIAINYNLNFEVDYTALAYSDINFDFVSTVQTKSFKSEDDPNPNISRRTEAERISKPKIPHYNSTILKLSRASPC